MAAAAAYGRYPRKRANSFPFLPPEMSELRIVLLGNIWSQWSSVGNFILGTDKFKLYDKKTYCVKEYGQDNKIVVINTPDLMLDANISEKKLTEMIGKCASLCDPGPHVFLLVLQPEGFSEEDKQRLCRVLERFSDRSFDHSLVMILASKEETSGFLEHPPLKDLIRKCKNRLLSYKNLKLPELLTYFSQMVTENHSKHVSYEPSLDPASASAADLPSPKLKETQTSFTGLHRSNAFSGYSPTTDQSYLTPSPELRILLLGSSEDEQTKLANFITGEHSSPNSYLSGRRGKPPTVFKTPNFFTLSPETLKEQVKSHVTLCHPGPNVLLLLVKPSEFTEKNRQTLKFILSLFGPDALKFSMVVVTHTEKMSQSANKLLHDCEERCYKMSEDTYALFMIKIMEIVRKNKGAVLTFSEEIAGPECESHRPESEDHTPVCEDRRPSLNLVLCGRRGTWKTSAARAILGQKEVQSVSDSLVCRKGEVFGRWVSLVELPALYGKPLETGMKESFRCTSLFGSEGVHALVLVLPVNPLTDEDKGELDTILKTFGSEVNNFAVILFTVRSDQTEPTVLDFIRGNKDIQKFHELCGRRHVVANVREKQQIPKLLDKVEQMRTSLPGDKPRSYTSETFVENLIVKLQRSEKIVSCKYN
ncbi:uncharacterized protein V6R79_016548 [Siganus canaliculatus]